MKTYVTIQINDKAEYPILESTTDQVVLVFKPMDDVTQNFISFTLPDGDVVKLTVHTKKDDE